MSNHFEHWHFDKINLTISNKHTNSKIDDYFFFNRDNLIVLIKDLKTQYELKVDGYKTIQELILQINNLIVYKYNCSLVDFLNKTHTE